MSADPPTPAMRPAAIRRRLYRVAVRLHRLFAHPAGLSRVYLAAWAGLLRRLPAGPLRSDILNTLQAVGFTANLPARAVRLGARTAVVLKPHPGALDFPVYFDALDYEPEVFKALDARVADYDTVVEIGANVGIFTVYFGQTLAAAGRNGRVIAFEPAPDTFRMLLDNLDANRFDNITAVNCAIDRTAGLRRFYAMPGGEPTSSLSEEHAGWHSKALGRAVTARNVLALDGNALDRLIGDGSRVLLKIDAERAEVPILRGLESFVRTRHPDILIEVLKLDEPAFNELAFVSELYRLFQVTGTGLVETPRFIADATYRHRDYFLTPKPTDGSC